MAKTDVKGTGARVQRVLEDDFVQEQVRAIAGGLRSSYQRAREQRGKSVEDKKLYGNLQQVATSTRNLFRAVAQPEPEPSHRARRFAFVVMAVAGTAALTIKMQKLETQRRANRAAATAS